MASLREVHCLLLIGALLALICAEGHLPSSHRSDARHPSPPPFLYRVGSQRARIDPCSPVPLYSRTEHAPSASSTDGYAIQHVQLVNSVRDPRRNRTTFLFRGASPDLDDFLEGDVWKHKKAKKNLRSRFLYQSLLGSLRAVARNESEKEVAAAFPPEDEDVYLIVINLLQAKHVDDAARIAAEREFLEARHHTSSSAGQTLGELHVWETHGTKHNASDTTESAGSDAHKEHRGGQQRLVRQLRAGKPPHGWSVPDNLAGRMVQLERMLTERPSAAGNRTIVIFAHCWCGSDRTGELMGAWNLHFNEYTWREAVQENRAIAQRPMGCANYRAMQWYCLWLEGQRKEKLGCRRNMQCTEFDEE